MPVAIHARYAPALALLLLALALGALALRAGRRARPESRNGPFQGGARVGNKTWVQFRIRYAVWMLVFIAFDMEMVYMFPWAVAFRRLGLVAFLDMLAFLAILISALAFAWKEGALTWER